MFKKNSKKVPEISIEYFRIWKFSKIIFLQQKILENAHFGENQIQKFFQNVLESFQKSQKYFSVLQKYIQRFVEFTKIFQNFRFIHNENILECLKIFQDFPECSRIDLSQIIRKCLQMHQKIPKVSGMLLNFKI